MENIPPELLGVFVQFPLTTLLLVVVFIMEKRQDKQWIENLNAMRALSTRIDRLTMVFVAHHMTTEESETLTKILHELGNYGGYQNATE